MATIALKAVGASAPALQPSDRFAVHFPGDGSLNEFLKPEEVGKTLVSDLVEFRVKMMSSCQTIWAEFAKKLEGLLVRGSDHGRFDVKTHAGKLNYRITIGTSKPSNELSSLELDLVDEVILPVKFKLISNIPHADPRSKREQSLLAQLASVCGPDNLVLRFEGLDAVSGEEPSEWSRLSLRWNNEGLCWEAETELCFKSTHMPNFGGGGRFKIFLENVKVEMNNAGVAQVLQRFYERPGVDWRHQRHLLERGAFADMQISSKHSGTNRAFKCSRIQLAEVSPMLAWMFENNPSGDDAPCEAKRGRWLEDVPNTFELPESDEAIEAMLHFIYYGGCRRIFRGWNENMEVVVELLEAGHCYDIPTLVQVAAFVLLSDADEGNSDFFTAGAIMRLFDFSKNLEGEIYSKLKARSFEMLSWVGWGDLMVIPEYRKLHNVALSLGPVYDALLDFTSDAFHMIPPNYTLSKAYHWTPKSPTTIGPGVTVAKANKFLELLRASKDFDTPRNLDFAVGIMELVEFCGEDLPPFATGNNVASITEAYRLNENKQIYLIDLARLCDKKEGEWWRNLKQAILPLIPVQPSS